jgi:hypothetical protein
LIVQGGFALVFQTCMYHPLVRLTPLLLTLSLSPCFLVIQQITVHYIILFSLTDAFVTVLFTLYYFLFLSFLPIFSSDPLMQSCSFFMCVCIYMCVCMCICLCVYKIINISMCTYIF